MTRSLARTEDARLLSIWKWGRKDQKPGSPQLLEAGERRRGRVTVQTLTLPPPHKTKGRHLFDKACMGPWLAGGCREGDIFWASVSSSGRGTGHFAP